MQGSAQPSHTYLLNCTVQGDVPVLLVHVVVASPGLIPYPHTKVLDLCWVLLSDLQHTTSLLKCFWFRASHSVSHWTPCSCMLQPPWNGLLRQAYYAVVCSICGFTSCKKVCTQHH